jgi:hypothetical protein
VRPDRNDAYGKGKRGERGGFGIGGTDHHTSPTVEGMMFAFRSHVKRRTLVDGWKWRGVSVVFTCSNDDPSIHVLSAGARPV